MQTDLIVILFLLLANLNIVNATNTCVANAYSSDTTVNTLPEITIESESTLLKPGVATFIPSSKEKNAASGGYHLLRLMNLPTIDVNPLDNVITTIAGQPVAVYINGVSATPEDISAIDTKDVKKIEVLDAPTALKYNGNKNVIDFIIAKYEYGGYTRLAANQSLNLPAGNVNIFSKMVYKRMTYDINITSNYSNQNHYGSENRENFIRINPDLNILERNNKPEKTFRQQRMYGGALRMNYEHKKFNFYNTLNAWYNATPNEHNEYSVNLKTDNNEQINYRTTKKSNSKQPGINWKGFGVLELTNGWQVSVVPELSYSKENYNSQYYTDNNLLIINNATDRHLTYKIDIGTMRIFNPNPNLPFLHSFNINISSVGNSDRVDYTGKISDRVKSFWHNESLNFSYTYQTQRFYVVPELILNYYEEKIGNNRQHSLHPVVHINSQLALNSKNFLMLWLNYNTLTAGVNERTNLTLQTDELMWYRGNPKLKCFGMYNGTITYLSILSKNYTFSTNYTASYYENPICYFYEPYEKRGIITLFKNSGGFFSNTLSIVNTLKLFNRSLSLKLTPSISFYKSHGEYNDHLWSPELRINVTSFIKQFSFNAWIYSSDKRLRFTDCSSLKHPWTFGITATWANNNWNISLNANNFTRYHWKKELNKYHSTYYNFTEQSLGDSYHANFSISINYTFRYGKKVKGNEIETLNPELNNAIIK